eukprot:scaffold83368_cov61-Attheya_sp.AAC.1
MRGTPIGPSRIHGGKVRMRYRYFAVVPSSSVVSSGKLGSKLSNLIEDTVVGQGAYHLSKIGSCACASTVS